MTPRTVWTERDDDAVLFLSRDKVALIDRADVERCCDRPWFCTTQGYAARNEMVEGRRTVILLHRFLLDQPVGLHVDHINGDKLDNRRRNLRVVSCSQNLLNTGLWRNNRSGVSGVHWDTRRRKWAAQQRVDGVNHSLGRFATFDEAVAARRAAEAIDPRYADSPRRYQDAA